MTEALPPEEQRLADEANRAANSNWKRWGPYLSERQWGTVREDYSNESEPWTYFTHDQAQTRAYRWGEDGLLGFCDRQCRLCFAVALWNGNDPILKERLFGVTGKEGNHGEDVKEQYFYLDATPTYSYAKALYKYPKQKFPYQQLIQEGGSRTRAEPEYELVDTGVFDNDDYFDVQAEYAKASDNDLLIRLTVFNRSDEPASIRVLPTLWFRNTWTWGCDHEGCWPKPSISLNDGRIVANHLSMQTFEFSADIASDGTQPNWLFTENETNPSVHPNLPTSGHHFKDAFHRYVVHGEQDAVNEKSLGTKVAADYSLNIPPGEHREIRLRLQPVRNENGNNEETFATFDSVFQERLSEADEFYKLRTPQNLNRQQADILRQANAGLLWTKQFYHYIVEDWLEGDLNTPVTNEHRKAGRNSDWRHLFNRDVISMPDKWEYPWYAAWDSAFHMIPFAGLDPTFTREQLILFLREWYMHPNGQIPAYEWNFSDVNPPVHAWSCLRVYQLTRKTPGARDFLARTFQKLLLNFTWWVNRKDDGGNHIFAGGFLGLDNIGVFDRSRPIPNGGLLEQADGTAWMAHFGASMLRIALELAVDNPPYADMASKFFEHYIEIAGAMNSLDGTGLWDEDDGFYYDHLRIDNQSIPLRIRSLVGLVPLFAVCVLDDEVIDRLPGFRKRTEWFVEHRGDLLEQITYLESGGASDGGNGRLRLLAMPTRQRLQRILTYMLDESEFLSPYGIRSLSKIHESQPFIFELGGEQHSVQYTPGESDSWLFGGNSNWRGPIWFPMNYLIIESLDAYHSFYGDSFQIECPTGSGQMMNLKQVADELSTRLVRLFLPDESGHRPCHRDCDLFATNENWRDLVLFYEYFNAETGKGLGASHQTGWTALVASLLQRDVP